MFCFLGSLESHDSCYRVKLEPQDQRRFLLFPGLIAGWPVAVIRVSHGEAYGDPSGYFLSWLSGLGNICKYTSINVYMKPGSNECRSSGVLYPNSHYDSGLGSSNWYTLSLVLAFGLEVLIGYNLGIWTVLLLFFFSPIFNEILVLYIFRVWILEFFSVSSH